MIAEKLRKSILQAAIRGKLTEQLSDDGDARELLAEIKAEKARLVKEGKIKKEKPLPEITEEEIPFDIPENWCWVRVGEISEFINGDRSSAYPNSTDYVDDGVPFFGAADMIEGKLSYKEVRFISEEKFASLRSGKLRDQDLVCLLRGSIGKTAKFKKNEKYNSGFINAQMVIIRAINQNCINYLESMLISEYFNKFISGVYTGTAVKQLPAETLRKLIIPLPPIAEQQRIVLSIERAFDKIKALEKDEQKLQLLQKSFPKKMKDSLLQAAIQGKLTEQLEADGDARTLVAEIQKEIARLIKEGKIKKGKALPEITEEEIPFEIPDNWCWVRIGCVLQVNPRNQLEDDLDVSFIPMALISDGYNNKFTAETRKWKKIKSGFTHFSDDDVVLAKIAPCFQNLKSAVMKNLTNGFGAGTTELHVLRHNTDQIDCNYLLFFLKNPLFIKDGLATMKGTAGQQRISTDFVKEYLLPLPPLAEQQRIVERLEQLLPLCDALE